MTAPKRRRRRPVPPIPPGMPGPGSGGWYGRSGAPLPADEHARAHLRHLELAGMRPDTIYMRARSLARLQAWLGETPVSQASKEQLYEWRASLAGLSVATVCAYVKNCRGYFGWLVDQELRPDNPAAKIPMPPSPEYQPRPIGEEDLMRALDGAPDRIRLWLVLGGWAGLRAIEIALLRRNCIRERAEPPVLIVAADATKGGRHRRIVDLCPFAAAELQAARLPAAGWAFPRLDGKPGPVAPHLVSHLCCTYLHEIGIPDTFHSLRHRFGTEAYRASQDLVAVQELMGHATPLTTRAYVKLASARGAEVVSGLPVPPGTRKAAP